MPELRYCGRMTTQPLITGFTEEEIRNSQVERFVESEWRAEGYALIEVHDKKQWELGDWLDRGVDALTKDKALKKAVQITKLAKPTLWDYARTSRAFRGHDSRRRELPWSHYKEVAIAKLDDQTRFNLLDQAESHPEGKWSIPMLRAAMRDEIKRQKGETVPTEQLRKMQVSVDRVTYAFFTRLAKDGKEKRDQFVGKILKKHVEDAVAKVEG